VLTENEMRRRMIDRGLEGTSLAVREGLSVGDAGDRAPKKAPTFTLRKLTDNELGELVKILADAERIVSVLERRGISFSKFHQAHYDGQKLPRFVIRYEGREEAFYEAADYEKRLDELGNGKHHTPENGDNGEEPRVMAEELHEVARINQIGEKLRSDFQLDLNDFLLTEEKSESGESLPTKFQLTHGDDGYDIASLAGICPAIRQIGGKGIEIKRFKGLGEMNADQLWETTMNPATRTLLSVRLDDAGEADRLFSILMGDDVDKRRKFIQDHALEVQNLDV
jgi:DNA gyrase subunit B